MLDLGLPILLHHNGRGAHPRQIERTTGRGGRGSGARGGRRAPLANGGHAAAGGPFAILRFAEPDVPDVPDIVYLEQLTSAVYMDKRWDLEHYAVVMNRLCAQVEQPDRTEEILTRIRAEI